MRAILMMVVCLCFGSAVYGQERITKMMAGPNGDQFRVAVAFITASDDSFKTQSLIFDVNPVKKNEQPTVFYVDLTTTMRSLATGGKKQKILVLRWGKTGEIEVKCEGGKWAKQTAVPETDKIVEAVKAVVLNVPIDAKKSVEFKLPQDIEEKVLSILAGLETSELQCVRDGN